MKKLSLLFSALLFVSLSFAQIPTGYYEDVQGQSGEQLKTVLHTIIKDHSVQSYTPGVWTAFYTTDRKPNGKVWDMYSDVPGGTPDYEWTIGSDQCGNVGSGEGVCYNREHSFPRSWFGDASPMDTELFHIYPTDGYVNGKRGSYPYGEVSAPTWTSSNGSKLGPNITAGYSGTVFEPIDEYKGDFARTYFYMATRYEDIISNWNSVVLDGSTYPVYTEWHLDMLIRWHEEDPVSQKETDRNNAIYDIQHNRNPFIDHPEYVASVWGIATTAPSIGNIYNSPLEPSAAETVTVYATITDNGTITEAILFWGATSGLLTNEVAMQASGDEYTADIPAHEAATIIYYKINAIDDDSEASISSEYSYTVSSPAGEIVLPLYEDFENGDLGIFTAINVAGAEQEWITYSYQDNLFAKMSGWNGSGASPNEDWLVTPHIDLDSYTNESLTFKTSMDYPDGTTTFQILYSTDYSGSGDPNLANWTDLSGQASFSTVDYIWVESGTIDLSSITGNEISFAFKFTCNTESETWQLDDINIAGTAIGVGLGEEITSHPLSIYPNPATDWIQLKGMVLQESKLSIFNYLGQIEFEENVNKGSEYKLNIDFLKSGIYILQLKDTDSNIQNFKLIIQ